MKSKLLKVSADARWSFIEVEGTDAMPVPLVGLQNEVGGYVVPYNLRQIGLPQIDAWVDEEGLLKSLPVNSLASLLTGIYRYGDMLVGEVVLAGRNEKGDVIGLAESEASILERRIKRIIEEAR